MCVVLTRYKNVHKSKEKVERTVQTGSKSFILDRKTLCGRVFAHTHTNTHSDHVSGLLSDSVELSVHVT